MKKPLARFAAKKLSEPMRHLLTAIVADALFLTGLLLAGLVLAELIFPGFMERILPVAPVFWLLALLLAASDFLRRRESRVAPLSGKKKAAVFILSALFIAPAARDFPLPVVFSLSLLGAGAIVMFLDIFGAPDRPPRQISDQKDR
ncbi:MAG TPA: hypothetical protein ENJ77_00280 [Candidatus Moranbacteria bacterium]|nr:hypothetical protein [Candidatus Moranbacteria bacterium]